MSPSEKEQVRKAKENYLKTAKYYIFSPPFEYAFREEEDSYVVKTIEKFDLPDKIWLLLDQQRLRDINQKISTYDFPVNYVNEVVGSVLAIWLAREFGFDDKTIRRIGAATGTHDLGKAKQKDHILYKPVQLTDMEREEMRRHPEDTEKILLSCGVNDPIFISCGSEHHMFYIDAPLGSNIQGYPFKKSPKNQPTIHAQHTSVAEVTETMCLGRPYRKDLELKIGSFGRAIGELEKWSDVKSPQGTQFNPHLAKLMVKFLRRIPE